jgi:hypothetical protein
MRKFNKKEKERIDALNELVTDSCVLFNDCVGMLKAYREEAAELLWYIELHASFPIDERDYRDYSGLFAELRCIDSKMAAVQAEVNRLETEFTQFTRQYTRLVHHLDNANEKGASKIFAQMEELALDLNMDSYHAKLDMDMYYSLFFDYRQKMRAILFN